MPSNPRSFQLRCRLSSRAKGTFPSVSDTGFPGDGVTCPFCGHILVTAIEMDNWPLRPSDLASELRSTASGHLLEDDQLAKDDRHMVKRKTSPSETKQHDASHPTSTSHPRRRPKPEQQPSTAKAKANFLKSILHTRPRPSIVPSVNLVYFTVLDLHGQPIRLEKPPPVLRRTASGHLFQANPKIIKRPETGAARSCSINELPHLNEAPAKEVEMIYELEANTAGLSRRSYAAVIERVSMETFSEFDSQNSSMFEEEKTRKGRRRLGSEDVWMQVAGV